MSLVTCVTIAACLIWSAIGNQEDDFTNVRLSCHRASYMVPIEKHEIGYIYLGANYENATARSLGECVTKCTKLDACESVNFWKHELMCQMNEGTVSEMSEFTLLDGGVYRELASTQTDSLGGCKDNPCKNGATCHEICDGSSRYYECTCSVSYEGYDCETAKCYSPSVPSNAHISGSYSWPVASGTQIQILCNDWYNLAGSSTVTCTTGSWSATPSCTMCSSVAAGCQNYNIPNSQITASSNYNGNHMSYQGRLYYQGGGSWAWCSAHNSVGQWLQVDIGSARMVTQVATQGRGDANQWVTSYKLYHYYPNGWTYVKDDNGHDKVFSANWDRNTVVYQTLGTKSYVARYTRFVVQGWYSHMSMRVEMYACTG
ncbi:lactadherin-like [Ptychodera flava]|uniref:lactadherin-like n=1 Tax=Ptychodera flava TaxID=63121 RepID=UPI003969E231